MEKKNLLKNVLNVNLENGNVRSFDLEKETELEEWKSFSRDWRNQRSIRVVGILFDRVFHALPLPKQFRRVYYEAEILRDRKDGRRIVGERITCQADDVQISLTVYKNAPKMTRTDVRKIGHSRFNPSFLGKEKR